MNLLKSILFLSALFSITPSFAQFTDQINTNRPGSSMGAFSVGKKIIQAEGGIYGILEDHKTLNYDARGFGIELAARGGLFFEQLEFVLESQFQFDQYTASGFQKNRSGFRQLTLGAKYLLYDPFKAKEEKPNIYSWKANHKFNWKQFIPAISGYAGVNYAMENDYSIPNESVVSPKVMLIAQNHFNSGLVLVTNIVADKIGSDGFNYGYVLTLTKGLSDKWTGFIENKGIKSDYYSDGIVTLGATYLLKSNMQIDASVSKNIKNTPSLLFGGFGFSWRFDKKHKPVEIKNGKEVKPKDAEKTEKSKRIDNIETIPLNPK
ncbi:transporter [Flavobacterium sp.]|uniref:transporter n=1 Tax=Flavobacterium sp. TaxID=239 RepID=UPI00286A4E55|nr:transporter [Flavobacterium sp.]